MVLQVAWALGKAYRDVENSFLTSCDSIKRPDRQGFTDFHSVDGCFIGEINDAFIPMIVPLLSLSASVYSMPWQAECKCLGAMSNRRL